MWKKLSGTSYFIKFLTLVTLMGKNKCPRTFCDSKAYTSKG